MLYAAKSPVWRKGFIDSFLAALTTVPGAALLGATPKIHLFGGPLVPTKDNVLADFTAVECAFSGYNPSTLSIVGGPFNADTNTRVWTGTGIFTLTGATPTGVATGYWIDAGASPNWVVAERFPASIPFSFVGDNLLIEAMFALQFKITMA